MFAVGDGLQGKVMCAIIEEVLPLGAENVEVFLLLGGHLLKNLVRNGIVLGGA